MLRIRAGPYEFLRITVTGQLRTSERVPSPLMLVAAARRLPLLFSLANRHSRGLVTNPEGRGDESAKPASSNDGTARQGTLNFRDAPWAVVLGLVIAIVGVNVLTYVVTSGRGVGPWAGGREDMMSVLVFLNAFAMVCAFGSILVILLIIGVGKALVAHRSNGSQ